MKTSRAQAVGDADRGGGVHALVDGRPPDPPLRQREPDGRDDQRVDAGEQENDRQLPDRVDVLHHSGRLAGAAGHLHGEGPAADQRGEQSHVGNPEVEVGGAGHDPGQVADYDEGPQREQRTRQRPDGPPPYALHSVPKHGASRVIHPTSLTCHCAFALHSALTTPDSAPCGANPTLSQISRAHSQIAATDRQHTHALESPRWRRNPCAASDCSRPDPQADRRLVYENVIFFDSRPTSRGLLSCSEHSTRRSPEFITHRLNAGTWANAANPVERKTTWNDRLGRRSDRARRVRGRAGPGLPSYAGRGTLSALPAALSSQPYPRSTAPVRRAASVTAASLAAVASAAVSVRSAARSRRV